MKVMDVSFRFKLHLIFLKLVCFVLEKKLMSYENN